MKLLGRILALSLILGLLMLWVNATHAEEAWTSFVIHVRQGKVEGPVVGGKCKGDGSVVGCARRTPSVEGAWLDGECWVTVRYWDEPIPRAVILQNWGHELAHCVEGAWHE